MRVLIFFLIFLFVSHFSFAEECKYCIPKGSNMSCKEIENALNLINKIRAEVGVPPLKWDCKLAKGSQRWSEYLAEKGVLQHSSGNYGENLYYSWTSYGAVATLSDAIKSWYSEKKYFVYGKSDWCKGGFFNCGHYTQLIWKDTKYIGCGKTTKDNKTFIVCRFYPAGNVIGKQPY